MQYTTTVRVRTDESDEPIPGVKVALFDHDLFSRDDSLGTEVTDASGEVRFQYTTEQFADFEDRASGGALPDLYAVVYSPGGEQVTSTRTDTLSNSAAKYVTIRIARDLAEQYQLLPGGA